MLSPLLNLLSGDIVSQQHCLREKSKCISNALKNKEGYGFVSMTESEKKILFPVMEGMEIPFMDEGINGVLIGLTGDLVKRVSATIAFGC